MDSKLLNDRISRLKEWEQKESLNEILFNALSSLNAYTKERFDTLTDEIRNETAWNNEPPVIKMAVCATDNIDQQLFLHPVSIKPPIKSPGYITTVFAECDYHTIQKIIGRTFTAEIQGKTGTYRTRVSLRYSQKYLQKLESLYHVFSANELPWTTVKGMYFYKFLDVFSKKDLEQEIDEIKGVTIDFSPYEPYISYDKTLLWNICPLSAPVALCEAKPAYNTIQYEHTLKNLQPQENQYLICPMGERFTSFKRGQTMFVRTTTGQLEQIELLRIIGSEDEKSPLFLPLKSNRKKNGFIDTLARGHYIPTRGEAERIVHALSVDTDLRLADIRIIPNTPENAWRYKGIDYNYFVETNALLVDKKLMLFTFKSAASEMWAYETMFFVLSELQLYFYEYRCVGEIQ